MRAPLLFPELAPDLSAFPEGTTIYNDGTVAEVRGPWVDRFRVIYGYGSTVAEALAMARKEFP